MQFVPFHFADVFDGIDDKLWCHSRIVTELKNAHAPL